MRLAATAPFQELGGSWMRMSRALIAARLLLTVSVPPAVPPEQVFGCLAPFILGGVALVLALTVGRPYLGARMEQWRAKHVWLDYALRANEVLAPVADAGIAQTAGGREGTPEDSCAIC